MRWRAARARPEAEICGTRRCPRAGTGLQRPRTSSLDTGRLVSGPVLYNTIHPLSEVTNILYPLALVILPLVLTG